MNQFIKGLALCEGFFNEAAKPILSKHFPNLQYSAGLIGYGSDVLGYDDAISTDHMWGPRFYLFLAQKDMMYKKQILDIFSREFPYCYKGYSVNFSEPDINDGGVRHPEFIAEGKVSPLVFIESPNEYLDAYLGVHDFSSLTLVDWLTLSEHRLLAVTAGKLFVDGLHMQERRDNIQYYPEEVRLYLIASNWSLIAEEQAFVRRCHEVGDEVGSILVCSRILERLMRLSFLYCKRYAPYSKWFGKAFGLLPIDEPIKSSIYNAATAKEMNDREEYLVMAQKLLADLHNSLAITEQVDIKVETYFGRSSKVIFADKLAEATKKKLVGTSLENAPLIGSLSQVANFSAIADEVEYQKNIKALYL